MCRIFTPSPALQDAAMFHGMVYWRTHAENQVRHIKMLLDVTIAMGPVIP